MHPSVEIYRLCAFLFYSIITDHLGTPSQMYNEEGKLFWQGSLDSYGRMRMERGETGSCPFRYQGQYEDKEIGLYYNRFRYYSPEEGVYISQDPISLAGGNKLYGYVKDTSGWVDVFGLTGTSSYFSEVSWKNGKNIWKKTKLSEHYEKHVVKHKEFGDISMNQYRDEMVKFLNESGNFKEAKIGNQIIKFDPDTNRVLVGHAKDREIQSFYIAKVDFIKNNPFDDAIDEALRKTGLNLSNVLKL